MSAIAFLDQFDYHHRLAATMGPALVFFSAPACGACKRLRGMLGEACQGMSLFEVDVARDQALAHEFALRHLPAMFLYVDGSFHCEVAARNHSSSEQLRSVLADALSGPAGEAP